jgi:hypothetical protein
VTCPEVETANAPGTEVGVGSVVVVVVDMLKVSLLTIPYSLNSWSSCPYKRMRHGEWVDLAYFSISEPHPNR